MHIWCIYTYLYIERGDDVDRVPYRRITPPRHERPGTQIDFEQNEPEEKAVISRIETIVMQCILSAIVFVLVLVASFVDIAPAITIRNGIKQVLAGAETMDELVMDIRRFGSEWLGLDTLPVLEIHEYTDPAYEFYEGWFYDHEQTENPIDEYQDVEQLTQEIYIYDNEDRMADEASNPTVPEPPITPGLWD